jgi:hypothetical protein
MIWLGLIALLLIVLLALPWGLELTQSGDQRSVRLIAAGVSVPLPRRRRRARRVRNKSATPSARPLRGRDYLGAIRDWLDLAREIEWRKLYRNLKRELRCVHVHVRRLDVVISTPDPALTGMLYGWSLAANSVGVIPFVTGLEADFTTDTPRVDASARVTVIPWQLTYSTIRLLWSLPLRRLYALRSRRRIRNRREFHE